MIAATLAIGTGRKDILNLEVERGRVAYCCFENPDDIRMRLAISAFLLNVDLREIGDRIMVLDMRVKPEAVLAELRDLSPAYPFSLVFVDTLAAFFDGDDINNAVQGGEFTVEYVRLCFALRRPAAICFVMLPSSSFARR